MPPKTTALILSFFLQTLPFGGAAAFPRAGRPTSISTVAPVPTRKTENEDVQTHGGYSYSKPRLLTFVKNQPGNLKEFWTTTFRRKNTAGIAGMTLVTGLLIAADQSLFDEAWRWGDRMKISHNGQQKTFMKTTLPFTSYAVRINGPHDLGTALYFLGDGITHFSVAGGFLAYGFMKSDHRALQTSSQLLEGIFATGLIVQVLKHATGRENPNTLTAPGGKWRFFPNQKDYAKHVAKYDAYPSGHLATAMVTVTVISKNYPDCKFVRPIGYTLMSALAFQMVNNGVHWVSDYPLALYLGYTFGSIAVNRGRTARGPQNAGAWEIAPARVGDGFGLKAQRRFPFRTRNKRDGTPPRAERP